MRSRVILFGLALVAFLVAAILAGRTLLFVRGAEKAIGTVVDLESSNTTCRKKRGKTRYVYDCTKFEALIRYESSPGDLLTLRRVAGQTQGHNKPPSSAKFPIGKELTVLYDPADPSDARLDSFEDLWLGTSVAVFIGVVLGICMFLPTRARYG